MIRTKYRTAPLGSARHLALATLGLLWFRLVSQTPEKGILAPKPLYRDPVHDGAADPTLIWNRARRQWWMFYTNRRADLAVSDPNDVAWFHGTHLGVAVSNDKGATWAYHGVADIPYGKPDYTQWAPDIVYWHHQYHMFVVIVPGTFHDWDKPRDIIHLTSPDLERWNYVSKVEVGSDRIIDPCLFQLSDGTWRMWYKDERDHSYIHYADSSDLVHWTALGAAITDRDSEAPQVFAWRGQYWMIVDLWKGLGVYRSTDLTHWVAQPQNLLEVPGHIPTDRTKGRHCAVVVNGGHAFIYYFTSQGGADLDPKVANSERHTAIQVAELIYEHGLLTADRDQPAYVDLGPP